jgi:hypothetical protein
VPSQIITYLGAVFNLNKELVLPSENRFLAINQVIADIIYNRRCICPQNFVVWISLQGYPSENIPLLLPPQ